MGTTGSAQGGFNASKLADLRVPKPPLPEQQLIVAILDEAFEGIDRAIANTRQNLANARELFESFLEGVLKSGEGNWAQVNLSALATDITDGDHMPPPKAPTGVPFITISNITKDTHEIDFSDTYMVSEAYYDGLKPNKKPQHNDLLYTVTGSFGIPVRLHQPRAFCFQRHIGLLRPAPHTSCDWLYYLLRSRSVFDQANEGATGTAQKTVSLKVLRNFLVPLVPLLEQPALVEKLDVALIKSRELETGYKQKLTALAELKQSLLARAFSGELTATAALKDAAE